MEPQKLIHPSPGSARVISRARKGMTQKCAGFGSTCLTFRPRNLNLISRMLFTLLCFCRQGGQFWGEWHLLFICWAVPCRPASPVLAHPGDGGKEPILNNKDINGLVDGESYLSERRSWNDMPSCGRRQSGHGSSLLSLLGGGGGYQYQVGSSVTRETSRGACPSPPL